jgi:hypothetical protein
MICREANCPLCGSRFALPRVPDTNKELLPLQPCGACWQKLPPEERAPFIFTLRASPTLTEALGHRDPTKYALSPTLVAYVEHLEAKHNSTRLRGRPSPAALVAALSENLTHAKRGWGHRSDRADDEARIAWPKVGDFVRVTFAFGPSEMLCGWLISVSTPKPEFDTRYVIEDLGGVVRGWHQVKLEGVPLGNPYAHNQDERWAHPNHRELPLMDGSKIGLRMTSYDAEGKITQETAILPPTFTDDTETQENP